MRKLEILVNLLFTKIIKKYIYTVVLTKTFDSQKRTRPTFPGQIHNTHIPMFTELTRLFRSVFVGTGMDRKERKCSVEGVGIKKNVAWILFEKQMVLLVYRIDIG